MPPTTPSPADSARERHPVALADDPAAASLLAFFERITAELSQGPLNLPCFPGIVPRVRKALDDPKTTPDDLVRIAGTEPRLAARLMQTANAAVFNPAGVNVTTLRQAVTRLGHELVQSVTMAFAIQQLKSEPALRPVHEPLTTLWQKSLAVASICRLLARRIGMPQDKVFLAGLLHGIGYFYIMVRAATAQPVVAYDPVVAEFATDWHPVMGQGVLEAWGFEPGLCEAIARQNDFDYQSRRGADLCDILIASITLASAHLAGDRELAQVAGIRPFATLGLGAEEGLAILCHTEHALDSVRESLGG